MQKNSEALIPLHLRFWCHEILLTQRYCITLRSGGGYISYTGNITRGGFNLIQLKLGSSLPPPPPLPFHFDLLSEIIK